MAELVIRTEAQSLLDLVRQKKRIALREAAGFLNQPVAVVQSWALFLEEEGLLKIQYSLLKPYLVYIPSKAQAKVEKKGPSPFDQLLEDYKELQSKIVQVPKEAESETLRLKADIDGVYNTLLRNARTIVRDIAAIIEKQVKEKNVRQARQSLADLDILDQVMDLLTMPDKLLLAQEIEQVEQTLVQAEAGVLPQVFAEAQKKVEEQLAKGNTAIQAKDWNTVNDSGSQLQQLRQELPEELVDQYASSVGRINHFMESWLQMRSQSLKQEFAQKSQEITRQLISARQGKPEDAFNAYRKAHELFDKLPVGFLEERILLHKQITETLDSLTKPGRLEDISVPKPDGFSARLAAAEALAKTDRKTARQAYSEIIQKLQGKTIAKEEQERLRNLYETLK